LGIVLKQFPPPESVDEMLRSMVEDKIVLTADQMQTLLQELPSEELLEAMAQKERAFPDVPWDLPEKFLRTLGNIPQVRHRLTVWAFLVSHRDSASSLIEKLTVVENACAALRESEAAPLFFSTCVQIGNVVNLGSARGEAEGVTLESIRKMADVKSDVDGKSLFQYAVAAFEAAGGRVEDLIDDIEPVDLASGSWKEGIEKVVAKLVAEAKNARLSFEALGEGDAMGEDWKGVAKKLQKTEGSATFLQKRTIACQNLYTETLRYFCIKGDASTHPTEQFFSEWRSLLALVRIAADST